MLDIILEPLSRAYDNAKILQILFNQGISDLDLSNPHQTAYNHYPLQANEVS